MENKKIAGIVKGIIFDLDYTLADTCGDIAGAINFTLSEFGLPPLRETEVARHINHGVRELICGCFPGVNPGTDGKYEKILDVYLGYYYEHIADNTRLYDGIHGALTELSAAGLKLCVLSNKREHLTAKLVGIVLPDIKFTMVRGAREGFPLKPDPQAALELAMEMDVCPHETVFCGDSDVDMRTAKNAGMVAVGVTWGSRPREVLLSAGADVTVDTAWELAELFESGIK